MDLSGRTLNRKYEIIERIATSNMASVYKARQAGQEGIVAVKVLHEHLTSNLTFKKRFELEAKVLMQLQHPHIVKLIDFDTTKIDNTEIVFLVLEYIEGGTLATLLRQKEKLTVREATAIMQQLFTVLTYAHSESIAHRDIKPDNILFKDETNIVLSDFGLARLVDAAGLTSTTAITMGTIQYVAPEILQGKSNSNYTLVDIYGLGVVFYEMVTGRTPYYGLETAIISQKLTNQPFPPPHEVNPEVSLAISKVIMRALSFNPKDRYQTIPQFAEAVRFMPQMSHQASDFTPSPLQNWLKLAIAALIIIGIAVFTAFLGLEELFLESSPAEPITINSVFGDLTQGDLDLWLLVCCGTLLTFITVLTAFLWGWRKQGVQPISLEKRQEMALLAQKKVEPPKVNTEKTLISPQLQQQPITGVLVAQEQVGGVKAGATFQLRLGVNSIGRDMDNHIVLGDTSISRYHARVMVQETNFLVEDLRSSNGVKVNGTKVASQVLQENDLVELGRIKLKFVIMSTDQARGIKR